MKTILTRASVALWLALGAFGANLLYSAPAGDLKRSPEEGAAPQLKEAKTEVYKRVADIALEVHIFEPAGSPKTNRAAIVFFFGGGWASGSPKQFEPHCRHFASRGMVAIAADYRVKTRHGVKPVSCVADAKSCVRWVRQNADRLGIDRNRIVAAGGSAGGHLAAATATLPGFDEVEENRSISSVPNALVLFNPALVLAPWEGLAPDGFGMRMGSARLGAEPADLSPVHHVKPGTPPTIIFHGRADTTVPFVTAEAFTATMKKYGNRCELNGFEGQTHGFFNLNRNGGRFHQATLHAADDFLVSLGYLPRRTPPNVLFIAVDDLRPQLGCLGHPMMKTPNLDRLAREGTAFTRAYCAQAVCAPSRAAVLSGLRPDSTGIYDLQTPLRTVKPNVLTLPQFFKNHGYTTVSLGKIYHHAGEDAPGWTEEVPRGGKTYVLEENLKRIKDRQQKAKAEGGNARALQRANKGPATECANVPDEAYMDGELATSAVQWLDKLKDKPFFLAVGFVRPHLPFNSPKKYWELYQRERIPLPDTNKPPGHPAMAFAGSGELRSYADMPQTGPWSETQTRELIHGYYAAVSFVDAQIGRVLDALDQRGLQERTVVVLWGDHGWKLGEYGEWCKHTNFELDTHAPLFLRAPGFPSGQKCDRLVEFVDVYPTLTDLCEFQPPEHCEGISLVPLLRDPDRKWKTAAFSQYPRQPNLMGYSMRTDRWRFTKWIDRQSQKVIARELYDEAAGPLVKPNLADTPMHADLVRDLEARMKAGWRGALPPAN